MSLDVDFKGLKTAPDLRDGSVVKCTGHSSRAPSFASQHPHSDSRLTICKSSPRGFNAFFWNWRIGIYASKTLLHTNTK